LFIEALGNIDFGNKTNKTGNRKLKIGEIQ
jgi:hypothetical protein